MITKNLFVSFRREISIIRKKSAILSGLAALEYTSIPILVSVITLLLTGQPLTPVNVFMLLMFTNLLRLNICLDIAYGVVETRESFASLGRIEDFLISEDLFSISEDHCLHDRGTVAERKSGKLQNDFTSMSRSHVSDEDPLTDQRINPSKPGNVCVSHLTYKEVARKDEFILQDVDFVAALESLARAVYVDADLYLLDDPLSAVDFKVGRHIFEKCIKGLLSEKTRLLTSHQERHMKDADQVIVLHKGRVLGKGTFAELQGKGILNTTIDPLYKNASIENKSNDMGTARDDEERCRDLEPLTNKENELEISVEDRAIGRVSSKLYWDYFSSGIHSLLIIGMIFLCLISQGEL